MSLDERAVEPGQCPFCGTELKSPGAGFVNHIDDAAACRKRFERWRDRVADDMRGGWPA